MSLRSLRSNWVGEYLLEEGEARFRSVGAVEGCGLCGEACKLGAEVGVAEAVVEIREQEVRHLQFLPSRLLLQPELGKLDCFVEPFPPLEECQGEDQIRAG